MQELTVDFIMSLDGYSAAEGWPGWWGLERPEYLGWLDALPEKDHPILIGAAEYPVDVRFVEWGEPGTEMLTEASKVVFSSSLPSAEWANTTLVRTDAVEAVRALKEESERPLLGRSRERLAVRERYNDYCQAWWTGSAPWCSL